MSHSVERASASDQLWLTVMQNEIDAYGNPQGKKWRTVRKDATICDSCKDSGAIVLLRCGHDKCPREYHVDCAFHQGGLSLDDNGVLTVFCDAHFKPLVFCSCKEAYDDLRPMVYCDECSDWFHNSCEGLSATAPLVDTYICKNCKDNLKHGRSVSKTVKEKNMNKEQRSTHQLNARRLITLLSELEGGLCPIIDEIARAGKSQFSIKDIQEAKEVLSAPPFLANSGAGVSEDTELLISLGVMSVVEKWRSELTVYLNNYDQWLAAAQQHFSDGQGQLKLEYGPEQMGIVAAALERVAELAQRAAVALVGTPRDVEVYEVFKECLQWMHDFLQVGGKQFVSLLLVYLLQSVLIGVKCICQRFLITLFQCFFICVLFSTLIVVVAPVPKSGKLEPSNRCPLARGIRLLQTPGCRGQGALLRVVPRVPAELPRAGLAAPAQHELLVQGDLQDTRR